MFMVCHISLPVSQRLICVCQAFLVSLSVGGGGGSLSTGGLHEVKKSVQ